jgi:hypothetical protein
MLKLTAAPAAAVSGLFPLAGPAPPPNAKSGPGAAPKVNAAGGADVGGVGAKLGAAAGIDAKALPAG